VYANKQILFVKVMEAYRKIQLAKQKKKTPTKKEKETVVKLLKDREQLVKALDIWIVQGMHSEHLSVQGRQSRMPELSREWNLNILVCKGGNLGYLTCYGRELCPS